MPLPCYMGAVPEYEVVNGNMRVTLDDFALEMPINVFLVGCAKGRNAIVQWERQRQADAEVIPFRQEFVDRH